MELIRKNMTMKFL